MLQKVLKSWVYLERKWATLSARRQGWRREGKTTLFEAKYVSILEISISSKLNHSRHFMHCISMYLHPTVTYAAAEHQGRLFWITCKQLKLLRKASRLQVIQNSVPSVVWRCQCDNRIRLKNKISLKTNQLLTEFKTASLTR